MAALSKAAAGHGMLTLEPEPDGVVRRVPLVVRSGERIYPSLTLEMVRVATSQKTIAVQTNVAGVEYIKLQGIQIPTDARGRIWVRYARLGGVPYVSAADILAGTAAKDAVAGKFVLIGTSAEGLFDLRITPVTPAMPGVEVHANMLETFLSQQFISRPGYANSVELFAMILAGLAVMLLIGRLGPIWTLFLLVVVTGALAVFSGYIYIEEKLLVDVTQPAAVTFAVYLIMAFDNYFREASDKRRIRNAFSHYLSPAMVESLAKEPGRLKLGGETKELSILFCDVRGFTSISEAYKDDPQGLTVLINRLLTPLTEKILRTNGTIDKYMGDCIMAFWNAPMDEPLHARLSCQASLEMLEAMEELNAELKQEAAEDGTDYKRLDVGVGLNTGAVVVGNMGSLQRFDYSILGDDVNLAARLEGQSKTYGVKIVVGENTRRLVNDFAFIELDLIAVKGRSEAARIFTLLGGTDVLDDPKFVELEAAQTQLLQAYRAQDWACVEETAQQCEQLWPALAGLYALYRERMIDYQAEPLPSDWDGVYVAQTK